MTTRRGLSTLLVTAMLLASGCRDQTQADAAPVSAKDLPPSGKADKKKAHPMSENDPCLGGIPSSLDLACEEDQDCVAIKGPCGQCWGSVNRKSGASVQNRVRSADKGKKCAESHLPPAPLMFCNAKRCQPEFN